MLLNFWKSVHVRMLGMEIKESNFFFKATISLHISYFQLHFARNIIDRCSERVGKQIHWFFVWFEIWTFYWVQSLDQQLLKLISHCPWPCILTSLGDMSSHILKLKFIIKWFDVVKQVQSKLSLHWVFGGSCLKTPDVRCLFFIFTHNGRV